jgi:hypothetical protein
MLLRLLAKKFLQQKQMRRVQATPRARALACEAQATLRPLRGGQEVDWMK